MGKEIETPNGIGEIIDQNGEWVHVRFGPFNHDWFLISECE